MQGDSFHFAFPFARDAVAAAGQRALAGREWESEPILVRIGRHTGEPMQSDDCTRALMCIGRRG